MVIDDDYVSNFIADHILCKLNICDNVSFSRNGDEAIKFLKQTDSFPELIFLDINMPVMDGFEFIETFKSFNLEKQKTRIIIYTSSLTAQDIAMLKEAGFADFILKPLTEDKLLSLLKLFKDK